MDTQIKAWGNSQGVRLPKEVLTEAGFQLDETLEITVSQGEIILKEHSGTKRSKKELLPMVEN